MKKTITIIGMFVTTFAFATDDGREITTSQRYVETQLSNRQDTIPAKSGDKVVTPTSTKGTIGEREIKTTLGNETTNQNDTGITTVGTVNTAVYAKQNKIKKMPSVNIVTYTGTNTDSNSTNGVYGAGIVTSTPIYDENVNTYGNGLVRAETLNTAVQRGVSRALTQVPAGFLINNIGNVLPTTAYLDANINGTNYCYKRIQTDAEHSDRRGTCSTALYDDMVAGDWGVVMPYETGITYNGACTGANCGREIRGISVCIGQGFGVDHAGIVTNTSASSTVQTAYENGIPSGSLCYCKMTNPTIGLNTSASPWVYFGAYNNVEACASYCTYICALRVYGATGYRGAVFGGVDPTTVTNE